MAQVITPLNNLIQTQIQKYAPVFEKVNNVKEGYGQKIGDYKEQIMQYKNQALEKGEQYKNIAMEQGMYYKDQAMEKGMQYKGQVIEKTMYYKVQVVEKNNQYQNLAIEKGKNHKVTQYSEEQLQAIISFMEKQVQQLSKNYLHKSIGNENDVNKNIQEQSLVQRIQILSQTINVLAKMTIEVQLNNIKQMPVTQKSIAMYQQLLSNPRVREAIIFTSISQEFLSDIIQTKLLTPSITYFDNNSMELKNQTKITMQNIKTRVVEQYIPLLAGKYETFRNSTVYLYENSLTIEFAKDYYQNNKESIRQEMKDLYDNFMQYQKNVQQNYQDVYNNAIDSYKKRRFEMIENKEKNE